VLFTSVAGTSLKVSCRFGIVIRELPAGNVANARTIRWEMNVRHVNNQNAHSVCLCWTVNELAWTEAAGMEAVGSNAVLTRSHMMRGSDGCLLDQSLSKFVLNLFSLSLILNLQPSQCQFVNLTRTDTLHAITYKSVFIFHVCCVLCL
jgi:hypothetical protein